MSKPTDFNAYKHQLYLELCLQLVEEALNELTSGHEDMAREHLYDILETFDETELHNTLGIPVVKNILPFPKKKTETPS